MGRRTVVTVTHEHITDDDGKVVTCETTRESTDDNNWPTEAVISIMSAVRDEAGAAETEEINPLKDRIDFKNAAKHLVKCLIPGSGLGRIQIEEKDQARTAAWAELETMVTNMDDSNRNAAIAWVYKEAERNESTDDTDQAARWMQIHGVMCTIQYG